MFEVTTGRLNRARVLDRLSRENISVSEVRFGVSLTFRIKARDIPKVRALIPDAKIVPVGRSSLLKFFLSRGIIMGAVLFLVFVILFSSLTLGVRVRGAERYGEEILSYLKSEGYGDVQFKSDGQVAEIEKALMEKFPLSLVSASVVGATVDVLVKEELEAPGIVDYREKTPLISSSDGVVTRVVVTQGTALVKCGDGVKRGQTLIGNFFVVGETEEEIRAEGEVYARVVRSATRTVGKTAVTYERSGRTESYSYLSVFGVGEPPLPSFSRYEVEEKRVLTGDIVPIYAVYLRYSELVAREVELDVEQEIKRAVSELRETLASELEGGEQAQDFFHHVREVAGRIEVTAHLETEIIISVRG